MLKRCFLDFSVDVGALVIGLSQISSFFLVKAADYEITIVAYNNIYFV